MKKKTFMFLYVLFCLLLVGFLVASLVVKYAKAEEIDPSEETYIEETITEEPQAEEPVAEEPKEDVEWLNKIEKWGIDALVSLLGSGIVCVIFRKILLNLISDIKTRKKEVKDESDKSRDKIDEALQLLEKEKEEFEKEKKAFIQAGLAFYRNSKDAIVLMVCGITELVENGTAEKVKEMLNGEDKEI